LPGVDQTTWFVALRDYAIPKRQRIRGKE